MNVDQVFLLPSVGPNLNYSISKTDFYIRRTQERERAQKNKAHSVTKQVHLKFPLILTYEYTQLKVLI